MPTPLPKHNKEYWKEKFRKNRGRDIRKRNALEKADWTVVTVWDCELKSDDSGVLARIKGVLAG